MLPSPARLGGHDTNAELLDDLEQRGDYFVQTKHDGVRVRLAWDGMALTITSRAGADWSPRFPELRVGLDEAPPFVLDAELVAADFQAIQARAARLPRAGEAASSQVEARYFDVLSWGRDLRDEPLAVRLHLMQTVVYIVMPSRYRMVETAGSFFSATYGLATEGVVLKRATSLYRPGRTDAWVKVKKVQTSTCIATSYEAGSTVATGAVHLALIDDGTVRFVGKVGSGITMAAMVALRHAIDDGQMPLIEVAHLGTTSTGLLRQPVYKGSRHDATLTDATTDQLEIP